jgi:hypothetical protein
MTRTVKAHVALAMVMAVECAAGTTFSSKFRNPEAGPLNFKGKKVVALVMSEDESIRYASEDALARELTARGAVGIPAYTLIPKELTRDKAKAKEFVDKAGVVGVVAMRVAGKDTEVSSTPGGYWGGANYSSFWAGGGYYGWAWGGVYEPSYVRTDTVVSIEILVFSLGQDKLAWAGRSETVNPKKVGPLIKDLTGKVASELKKEGLIR